ncbi:MAG: SAM-dependent methyltransferase, partial [Proteobacteria bacterium]|nr:SAM-dependent methyltransferase [Pseudomonadota bacterium]
MLWLPAGALAQQQPDVPYVPTPWNVVEAMLEAGGVTANDYLIDLGSGDGRVVIDAA